MERRVEYKLESRELKKRTGGVVRIGIMQDKLLKMLVGGDKVHIGEISKKIYGVHDYSTEQCVRLLISRFRRVSRVHIKREGKGYYRMREEIWFI